MKYYFTIDGTYGEYDEVIVLDTNGWTDEDWQAIEEASDNGRIAIALGISRRSKV